jgi:hypothetical protein
MKKTTLIPSIQVFSLRPMTQHTCAQCTLMMEAVTSVSIYQSTQCNIPGHSHHFLNSKRIRIEWASKYNYVPSTSCTCLTLLTEYFSLKLHFLGQSLGWPQYYQGWRSSGLEGNECLQIMESWPAIQNGAVCTDISQGFELVLYFRTEIKVTLEPDGLRFIVVKVHYFRKSFLDNSFRPCRYWWSSRSGVLYRHRSAGRLLSACNSRRIHGLFGDGPNRTQQRSWELVSCLRPTVRKNTKRLNLSQKVTAILIHPRSRVGLFVEKLVVAQIIKKFPRLLCSQEPATVVD